jgi:hypothetical protein
MARASRIRFAVGDFRKRRAENGVWRKNAVSSMIMIVIEFANDYENRKQGRMAECSDGDYFREARPHFGLAGLLLITKVLVVAMRPLV